MNLCQPCRSFDLALAREQDRLRSAVQRQFDCRPCDLVQVQMFFDPAMQHGWFIRATIHRPTRGDLLACIGLIPVERLLNQPPMVVLTEIRQAVDRCIVIANRTWRERQ